MKYRLFSDFFSTLWRDRWYLHNRSFHLHYSLLNQLYPAIIQYLSSSMMHSICQMYRIHYLSSPYHRCHYNSFCHIRCHSPCHCGSHRVLINHPQKKNSNKFICKSRSLIIIYYIWLQNHKPLFDVVVAEFGGGPGGGSFGRITFLSTGFNIGISPLGSTNLAPAKCRFRPIDSPLSDRLWPNVVKSLCDCEYLCLSYFSDASSSASNGNGSYTLLLKCKSSDCLPSELRECGSVLYESDCILVKFRISLASILWLCRGASGNVLYIVWFGGIGALRFSILVALIDLRLDGVAKHLAAFAMAPGDKRPGCGKRFCCLGLVPIYFVLMNTIFKLVKPICNSNAKNIENAFIHTFPVVDCCE